MGKNMKKNKDRMMNFSSAVILTVAFNLGGFCVPQMGVADSAASSTPEGTPAATAPAEAPTTISADIVDRTGKKIGEVKAKQLKTGVQFHVRVSGLKPGMHGIHIHSVGKCDGPDFKSAGGHFAMASQHHGLENSQGPHWGDLPNLNVKSDGTAKATFTNKLVTMKSGDNSLMKAGGTALIIHADKDDQKSDPAGNAGGRVACAVLSK